ncbi:MAG: SpoIIE family protein phosphatase [Planctomycetia bacterium]|nr:SpoIIE family protein phosphatase [Planctomycetia bacterium]
MPFLVVVRGPLSGKRFELKKGTNVIGRNPECDIVFNVSAVSREHAKIIWRNNAYYIEDLKSRNLTVLNDKKVEADKPVALTPGDKVKICDFFCEYVDETSLPSSSISEDSGTVVSSVQAGAGSVNVLASQPAERLRVLLEVSNSLARAVEIGPLLPKILDGLFQVFRQADRGFFIVQDSNGQFVPKALKTRREKDESTARFSKTILRKCMDNAEALLIEDAAQNEQFQLAASISDFKIRSIMAAPLVSSDGEVFGVLQVDTQDRVRKFNQEDLQLLIAVANQAAVALDNVKLHENLNLRQKMQREIELAVEVQKCFLPNRLPVLEGYQFFAHYKAAREVGGDFYGFLPLVDNRLALSVGDIAGKGVPAALLMARVSGDVNLAVLSETNASQAVHKLNYLFHQAGISDRFVAFLLCILDPSRGTVTLVNAGQVPPLLRKADGTIEEYAANEMNGLPLGVVEDFAYSAVEVPLNPGECLLLCTDGITDANNSNKESFGRERLMAAMKNGAKEAPLLGQHVLRAVDEFATAPEQFDDLTLVCVSRNS